jgi:hypothetical protein
MMDKHKFSVGLFQGWLCGKQNWEVRHRDGMVMGSAANMMECAKLATTLNDRKKELDQARHVFDTAEHQPQACIDQARATYAALKRRTT